MAYIAYLNSIKDELENTGRDRKSLRVKTILKPFGYLRRSQAFVNDFNAALDTVGLCATPVFDIYLPLDARVSISIKGASTSQTDRVNLPDLSEVKPLEPIQVKPDFFYYLFDFGSEQEYERKQQSINF